jgi:hypothetical protein
VVPAGVEADVQLLGSRVLLDRGQVLPRPDDIQVALPPGPRPCRAERERRRGGGGDGGGGGGGEGGRLRAVKALLCGRLLQALMG